VRWSHTTYFTCKRLQSSDIPLLAVMQGGEYRSTATHALRLVEKFCNTPTSRGISATALNYW